MAIPACAYLHALFTESRREDVRSFQPDIRRYPFGFINQQPTPRMCTKVRIDLITREGVELALDYARRIIALPDGNAAYSELLLMRV